MAGEVTALLLQWSTPEARDKLIPLVYRELRRLAVRSLRGERAEHTLQPTALVHEAYQRLIDQSRVQWQDRAHFYAVAASLMRRILVDHARRKGAQRRGGQAVRVDIDELDLPGSTPDLDLVALDGALDELAAVDGELARIVELRFFAGLSLEETAAAVGSSRATVHRDWGLARAWLHRRLSG